MKRIGLLTASIVVAVAVSACSSAQPVSKAGGGSVPVTLRIGTDDGPGRRSADEINEFARQVKTISQGQIVVEPVWHADGFGKNNWNQLVARMVVKGDLDMGLIPASAWDTEGVTSLRVLQAPFLITSEDLAKQVVTADFAGEMLSGLDKAGVTGLALLPEGLRRILSFGKPILAPGDLKGGTVRAPRSEMTAALFRAFGAATADFAGNGFKLGVDSGRVIAAESEFRLASTLPKPTTATGNLILFPRVDTIVVNKGKFAGLTDGQRTMLRDAAQKTRDWAIGSMGSTEQAANFCKFGGTVVTTTKDNLTAFRAAAEPVYADLAKDAQTKALLDRIRALSSAAAAPPEISPCAPPVKPTTSTTSRAATSPSTPSTAAEQKFPDGIYRARLNEKTLIAAGVDPGMANIGNGLNTLTFQHGHFSHELNENLNDICTGTYSVKAGRVVIVLDGCDQAGMVLFSATWTLKGTALRFTNVENGDGDKVPDNAYWTVNDWTKIG